MHRTQEKYLRMRACENILLEILCFKHLNFQKITSVFHRCQRTTESSAFTLQGILQRKSRVNWVVLLWTFGGWFNHQLHSRLLVHANFKENRNYCTHLFNLSFSIFSSRVILKSGLPSQIAAEYVLKVEIK